MVFKSVHLLHVCATIDFKRALMTVHHRYIRWPFPIGCSRSESSRKAPHKHRVTVQNKEDYWLSVFYAVSQGSIFQMSIWLANLLLISANASESFKRLSGEDNTCTMWSIFLTLALAWFSLEIWCPFRLRMGLSESILDLSWTALGLFTFWYRIGFLNCK